MSLSLTINGTQREITSDPDTPLVYVLRDELKLKGTKLGCGLEQCGACAVMVDGKVALSCVTPVEAFDGKEITTIEGIAETETGQRVQQAFIEETAAQCGYCTSGLVVAATALLSENPAPDLDTTKAALTPHLCRCGSHPRVLAAIERASKT
ncbi:MAG: (2Fe-2S)-binding protein [Marivita sp.]|uniref:(2Fe-2S)-binding protein n=1 Tax=Marivita sp. TaxID=2003365 RepID=UPI0025C377D6|nr:(2Fe-2S)-binding protein [Marivita sp.]MCI5111555.1 (2Fe-2S)-binding protein [Marivita sp.]